MRNVSLTTLAAAALLVCLAGCTRDPAHPGEILILDEPLTLARGESLDTASHDFTAPADGTCVAIVEEDDTDLIVELQAVADGAVPAKVEVASNLWGGGVEIAAIAVAEGSRVS